MKDTMTPKERWLAALRMQPVDRLPFWPKILSGYPKGQTGSFAQMTPEEIHDWIGSDKHVQIRNGLRETRCRTSVETTRSDGFKRTVYRSPRGETAMILRYDHPTDSWHPTVAPVRTAEDIELMAEIFEDVAVELDTDALERARAAYARVGQDALTYATIGESPLMYWIEWLAGVENAHLLLADYPDKVERLFAAMHAVLVRKAELLCEHSPADALYLIENTSTTLISPAQFERYCAGHLAEYARIARAAGRNLLHKYVVAA